MSTDTELPEFLTVEETARMLRLHPRTIRNRINAGLLPAKQVKGGRIKLVAKADALALLEDAPLIPRTEPPLIIPPGVDPLSVQRAGLTNRLMTPEGRARAIEMLRRLRDEGDEEEQKKAAKVLENITPLSMRRWSPDDWTRLDDNEDTV